MIAGSRSLRARAVSVVLVAVSGALFGAGLLVSGMTRPAKVLGFLDIAGDWDPTLAFVMAGAVTVYAIAHRRIVRTRANPWFEPAFHLPRRRDIDARLVAGAALFGVGWGIAGMCPGPSLVLATSSYGALLFVVAMVFGMRVEHVLTTRRARAS